MENKAWSLLKKTFIYFIFLGILFNVCYSKTDVKSFQYKTRLEELLLGGIDEIKTTGQLWKWLNSNFLTSIMGNTWYNQQPNGLKNFLRDYSSFLVGSILFMIIYLILIVEFTKLMYLLVIDRNVQFRTFPTSLVTEFLLIIGKFNVNSFVSDAGLLGSIIYVIYATIMIIILFNFFISILSAHFSFERNKYKEEHQGEDSIVWMFLMNRVKQMFRIKDNSIRSESDFFVEKITYYDQMATFEIRMKQLTDHILLRTKTMPQTVHGRSTH